MSFFDDHGEIVELEPDAVEPDLDELQQTTDPIDAVAVRHIGPVFTTEMPARIGNSRNLNVSDVNNGDAGAAIETIGDNDDRRKYLIVMCTGFPIYVGHDKQSALIGTAAILPVGVPLRLDSSAPIYVRAAQAGTAVVSYWAGYWAD